MDETDKTGAAAHETSTAKQSGGRKEEATTSETLSDVEKTEKISQSEKGKSPDVSVSREQSSVPSPDGMFDENKGGRADGSDTGGPM